jgi:dolichol kinase
MMAVSGFDIGVDIHGAPPPVWRRLFHLTAGSSIPVAGIFVPDLLMVLALAALAAGGLGLDLARFRVEGLNRIFLRWLAPLLKSDEGRRITGATYMAIAALVVFLVFDRPVAVAALLFMSLGDPAAALVGRRMPGLRIFGKSPVGTAAFIAVSWAVVGLLVGSGVVDYHWGLMAGAVAAGLAELAPLPVDDNITVPIAAATAMYFFGV